MRLITPIKKPLTFGDLLPGETFAAPGDTTRTLYVKLEGEYVRPPQERTTCNGDLTVDFPVRSGGNAVQLSGRDAPCFWQFAPEAFVERIEGAFVEGAK